MRLKKARVQKYRSIRDTGWFDVEDLKSIFVGPNEAGKTVLFRALQQINAPEGVPGFDALRDYPRSEYNDITTKKVDPADVTVVEAKFRLEPQDVLAVSSEFGDVTYVRGRRLSNTSWHALEDAPPDVTYSDIAKDLTRLAAHVDARVSVFQPEAPPPEVPSSKLESITSGWGPSDVIDLGRAEAIEEWLEKVLALVDEGSKEEARHDKLVETIGFPVRKKAALDALNARLPIFILFTNYFRVRPLIHLEHLSQRLETGMLDDAYYDYGNECLLRLLGFTAQELSDLGKASEPGVGDADALQTYRDQLDKRRYQLNAASIKLTEEIRRVWVPDAERAEADRLRVVADQQYLKVVVEDDLDVEVELDQRSEGFQWLVSFFTVFFAETAGKHQNAILLLDEPGLSLHGLKQREFRATISRLAELNQTLYTTHSPFLVGPDELHLVRVVEMTDRSVGTKVHSKVTASDPGALLPLQEALGYDLAQSLFSQRRNLVLEGLTDYWYVDSAAELLRDADGVRLNPKIALVPASAAGKVVYFATILHAQRLKVAALLDSDAAGERAADQDILVHTLGNKRILRTKDAYDGPVKTPEIEDTLRDTLVQTAKSDLGWDVEATAMAQPTRPIVDIFTAEISKFSKYRLAKAFLRWARTHQAGDLTADEQRWWKKLIESINAAVK